MLHSGCLKTIGCCLLASQLFYVSQAAGEELRRRGLIGVTLRSEYDEEDGERGKSATTTGMFVVSVMPDSAAAQADLHAEDIIIKIGSDPTPNLDLGLKTLRKYFAGDRIALTILRGGEEQTVHVTLRPRPKEEWKGIDVRYGQAGAGDRRVRTLITKPTAPGKYPAILFIQGLSPRSIEFSFPVPDPLRNLVEAFTKAGFVLMRVDRLGTGDSDGLSVFDTTVQMDAVAFRSALARLKEYEFVDPDNVFVFAYSSGGAIAPLVAQGMDVEGVATYGTMARPWIIQAVEMMRRRWSFERLPTEEIAANSKKLESFLEQCFVEKKPPSEILETNPELVEFVERSKLVGDDSFVFGMSLRFGRGLLDLKIEDAWTKVDAPVLAIWGKSDFIASREDSELAVTAVNSTHPDSGTFLALPGICHFCCKASDQEESFLAGIGEFNPALVKTVTKWMKRQMKEDGS
ncbi:MAG: alpha/beta fold hydrolase [Planctomycetes bacterium]|nr:alpha/beta fold hydrolase [Planctomycetota bacterium]